MTCFSWLQFDIITVCFDVFAFYLISIGCCCFTAAFLTAWNISSWHFSYNALSLKPCLTTSNECATWTGFAICNYYIQSLRIFNWPYQHAPLSQWDCFKYSNIEHTLFVSNMTNFDLFLTNMTNFDLFLANMTNLTYFLTNMTNFDLFLTNMTYYWQIWLILTYFWQIWLILTNFWQIWLISTYYRQILLILTYFD